MATEEETYRGFVKEKLESILEQAIKTNGRVSSLERWQNYVLGFCACVSLFVIPLCLYVLTHEI